MTRNTYEVLYRYYRITKRRIIPLGTYEDIQAIEDSGILRPVTTFFETRNRRFTTDEIHSQGGIVRQLGKSIQQTVNEEWEEVKLLATKFIEDL